MPVIDDVALKLSAMYELAAPAWLEKAARLSPWNQSFPTGTLLLVSTHPEAASVETLSKPSAMRVADCAAVAAKMSPAAIAATRMFMKTPPEWPILIPMSATLVRWLTGPVDAAISEMRLEFSASLPDRSCLDKTLRQFF